MKMITANVRELKPSPTLKINELSREWRSKGEKIFRFGFGQSPFPIPDTLEQSLKSNAFQKDYLPVSGLPELKKAIYKHHQNVGLASGYSEDHIVVGPGSKELIFLTQLALGIPLLLPNPSWVSYAPQAQILKKSVYWIPTTSSYKLEASTLDILCSKHKISKGLLLLNYPCNPTGQILEPEELKAVADICRKYQLVVISDEIYSETIFSGTCPSISSYYSEGTIISTGLSKWAGAGGWRLGYLLIPDQFADLYKALIALGSETYSCASAPIQYAAVDAFSSSAEINRYLRNTKHTLATVAKYCYDQLEQAGVEVQPAHGGFYLFPNFSKITLRNELKMIQSSEDLCYQILEKAGVALLPGSVFGRDPSERTARLSFVDFDGKAVLDFLKKNHTIEEHDFPKLFPDIVEGMDRLCSSITKFNMV